MPIDQVQDGTGTPTDPDGFVADIARILTEVVSDPERALRLALDLLFSPSAEAGDGIARLLALRDSRGFVRVALDGVQVPLATVCSSAIAFLHARTLVLARVDERIYGDTRIVIFQRD